MPSGSVGTADSSMPSRATATDASSRRAYQSKALHCFSLLQSFGNQSVSELRKSECVWRQHPGRGQYPRRVAATFQESLPVLLLSWQERKDLGSPGRGKFEPFSLSRSWGSASASESIVFCTSFRGVDSFSIELQGRKDISSQNIERGKRESRQCQRKQYRIHPVVEREVVS